MKMIGSPYRCFAVIRRFLQHVLPSGFMNFPKLQLSPANAGTEVSSAAHLLNQRMDETHPREAERLCSPKRQLPSLCHSSVRVTTPGAVLISLMRLPFPKMTMLWVKLPEQPSVCPVKVTLVVPVQLALTVYVPLSSTFVQT